MRTSTIVILAAILGSGVVHAELKPVEVRGHADLRVLVEHMPLPEELEGMRVEMLDDGAEATTIMRFWYKQLPPDGRLTTDGVLRSDDVVLVDLKVDGMRFAWRTEADYQTGDHDYSLTIWWGAERKVVMELSISGGSSDAGDLTSYIEAGRLLRERDQFDGNHEILVDFSLGGREWTSTFEDWRTGELLPEDRRLLDEALDEELRQALAILDSAATMTPSLHLMCSMLTHPLLGEPGECDLAAEPVHIEGGKPSCTFDAWFGEPCSPSQIAESNLREQPELAGAGPPDE